MAIEHINQVEHNIYEKQPVIGIVSVNSIDFVKTVFDCFNHDKIAVFLSDKTDQYKIQVTGATQIIEPKSEFGWCDIKFTPKPKQSVAQISFTSGTTGKPKGVLLTHRALNDVVERLNEIMEIDSSIKEYVGVPVNYSFGFGRCRAVATAGGQFYIPENGFNPLEIRDMLIKGSINAISAVPSLWRTMFQCQEIFGDETAAVKWIEIGSQYMSRAEKEQLRQLFPQATIVQHYGLTEASRSTFLRVDKTQGEHLESVGKAYGKTEIKLSADNKITIKGPHVAETLLIAGQVKKNIDADGWHETNDLGAIKDGYIYYLGRSDDLINCGGIKVSPDNIEKCIRETLNIQSGIAVARVEDSVRGDAILVGILKSAGLDQQTIKDAAVQAAAKQKIQSADAVKIMEFAEFPTTATGKIQRRKLTQLYAAQMEALQAAKLAQVAEQADPGQGEQLLSEREKEIIAAWKGVLGVEYIDADSNFFEIGGDSLTAISVMVKMEKLGISPEIARGMLQGLSVRELAKRIETSKDNSQKTSHTISNEYTRTSMNINIVRGLLVLCVICGHWSDGFFGMLPGLIGTAMKPLLANIFAAGTPGFVIIYGVSAGYSMFSIFNTDPSRLRKILYTTLRLLAGGILVLALMIFANKLVDGEVKTLTDFTNSFYSVLTYYLLITATLPLWFKAISNKNPAAKAIFLSIILYCSHYYFFDPIGVYETHGFIELAKLMISAKYSYFNLTAGTLSGIAIGIIIRQQVEKGKRGIPRSFTWVSAAAIAAGFVVCSQVGMSEMWLVWPRPIYLWTWLFYIGLVLIVLIKTNTVLVYYNQFNSGVKLILQSLSSIGILAFPLFITHSMLLPLRNIMVAFGLASNVSLLLAMSLFLATFAFLFKKVHSVNFSW
ncbi:AMP-binding protein [Coleofasciculus sp.]|uniref:AMP-binding protein n=1 Tax=Coleofasciculus sp. TaxID=3100458 RepID=UPI0039FB691A